MYLDVPLASLCIKIILFSIHHIHNDARGTFFINLYYLNSINNIFIICDASIETCQKRISKRGDSLEEEYHNKKDLIKYKGRFMILAELCSELPNVMFVNTDEDLD